MPKKAKIKRSANYGFYADIMWCCLPLLIISCYYYGPRPLMLSLVAMGVAFLCDCALAPLHEAGYQMHEPSSECFALLIVMMMPATVRYFIVIVAVIAAVLAKEAFGGEGHYPFHPAAVGMVVAGVSWPDEVFRYPTPGLRVLMWDTSEVPLTQSMNATLKAGGLPTASTMNLLTGNVAGPIGTCAALLIVACGLYLLVRGRLHLSTVVPFVAVCIIVPWLLPNLNSLPAFSAPWVEIWQRIYLEKYMVLGGAMLFCAVFLACEPVTQPNGTASRITYGIMLGIMTVVFRYYSAYETGVCFALLVVDAVPEWLDYITKRAKRIRFMKKEEKRIAKHKQ